MKTAVMLAAVAVAVVQQEVVVPVHEEPRHHLVFETSGTRVLDVRIPPGDTTLFHTHSDPILYVTMSTSRTRSQNLGAEWTTPAASTASASAPAGSTTSDPAIAPSTPPGRMMSTTSYADKPQTHRVNNVGPTLFRLIGVTNESSGDLADTPSDGFDVAPEITNRWFRGYRHALTGDDTREHTHANPVAVVLATGSVRLTLTTPGAKPTSADAPGFVGYVPATAPHSLLALAPATEVIEVEIRRPR